MRTLMMTLAFATALSAMAQKGDHKTKSPEEKAQQRTERMVKELGLDAAQQAKVSEINLNFAKAMADVAKIQSEKDRKGRADVLKGARDTRLSQVLTPDQYKKFLSLREEHQAKKDADKDKDGSDD